MMLANDKHLVHLQVEDATKILLFVEKILRIMAKVYEFLSNGFEDIEALAPIDILRRGGIEVKTVSVTGDSFVETAHGITLKTDLKFEDITDFADVDAMLLPGGLPGATYTGEQVTIDGNIITGKGPGASFDFGYAILERFIGADAVNELKQQMMYLPPAAR